MAELIHANKASKILGVAMQLHNELGCGFSEKVYQDALEVLFRENNIPYEREKHITINFHGTTLQHDFFLDFLCYDDIVVELKAYSEILSEFESQVINYLHVGGYQLGILLNFGTQKLEYKFIPNHKEYKTKMRGVYNMDYLFN